MAKKVGVIGLGAMGGPMAQNILKRGFPLTVYDIRSEAVEELVKSGAVAARSPKGVAEASEIVLLSLPKATDVEEVVMGEEGILRGAKPGCILVNTTTVAPSDNKKLAEAVTPKGLRLLGSPVSGGQTGAIAGTLAVMVGGDKLTFEECREVLEAIGTQIFYTGAIGTSDIVKLMNNLIGVSMLLATMEALVLGVKAGIDINSLIDVLKESTANKPPLGFYVGPRILKRDFEPGFQINLWHKDIGLALDIARENEYPVIFGALAYQYVTELKARGLGKKDITAVFTILEELAGQKIS